MRDSGEAKGEEAQTRKQVPGCGEGTSRRVGKYPKRQRNSNLSDNNLRTDEEPEENEREEEHVEAAVANNEGKTKGVKRGSKVEAAAAKNEGKTKGVERGSKQSISVTLADVEVLDCYVCFEPLSIPVFQCENGHVACSSCCSKLTNVCPTCTLPIGYIRNRAIEKVLESTKVVCQNANYGCKAITSYNKTYGHHKICPYAPCACPLSDCNFLGQSSELYQHFSKRHKLSAVKFVVNRVLHVTLNIAQKIIVLQEEENGELFIINNTKLGGNLISVSHIAHKWKAEMVYSIQTRVGGNLLRFQSCAKIIQNLDDLPILPTSSASLFVPSEMFDSYGQLQLDIKVRRPL